MDRRRDIKVHLPYEMHIRLHMMKIRHGIQIGETVEAALEEYFELQAAQQAAPQTAEGDVGEAR